MKMCWTDGRACWRSAAAAGGGAKGGRAELGARGVGLSGLSELPCPSW